MDGGLLHGVASPRVDILREPGESCMAFPHQACESAVALLPHSPAYKGIRSPARVKGR